MTDKIVPVIVATGEVVGTAIVSSLDKNGKVKAKVTISNHELLSQHKGLIEILLDSPTKTHDAFLNGYSIEDKELYE